METTQNEFKSLSKSHQSFHKHHLQFEIVENCMSHAKTIQNSNSSVNLHENKRHSAVKAKNIRSAH